MFYKKNQEKELSLELFKNPTSEYRATPFWAWNDDLEKEDLLWQIERFKEMGFGGFHMHARAGFSTPYLSDDFFSFISACVDKAKDEGLLAYLYDEDRWPSGYAGGFVTKNPKYRQKALVFVCDENREMRDAERWGLNTSYDVITKDAEWDATSYKSKEDSFLDKRAAIEACAAKGQTYLLAAFDVVLNEDGTLKSAEIIPHGAKAEGKKWLAFVHTYPTIGRLNNATYVDTLCDEAIKEFLATTHEKYLEKVGSEFGKTVPSIFTDEPQMPLATNIPFAHGIEPVTFPWTTDFPDTFMAANGIDLIPQIPELFWDKPGIPSKIRLLAIDHAASRFNRAFFEQYGRWCREHGLLMTGHVMYEDSLYLQTSAIGEAMRAYRHFGIPGMDILCGWMELSTAKQAQSAVHQHGKEAMLSELYGVTGWQFDFRGHKFQGDWQAALGVNVRVPHLSFMSMRGSAKRDFPASISYQSEWFREYKYIEDHYARLNTALTRGKPLVDVAVIHPIESYWLMYGPGDLTADKRNALQDQLDGLNTILLRGCIDFDYIAESEVPEFAYVGDDNRLHVGEMSYAAVIVPSVETLRSTTVSLLTEFAERGGRVIFADEYPRCIDGELLSEPLPIFSLAKKLAKSDTAILGELADLRKVELIYTFDGSACKHMIYNARLDGKYTWLFLAQLPHLYSKYEEDICEDPTPLFVRLKGKVKPVVYDTMSGEVRNIPYRFEGDVTVLDYTFYPHDSLLLRLEAVEECESVVAPALRTPVRELSVPEKVQFSINEENVLVLDMPEWSEDGIVFNPREEMLRIDGALRKKYGYPMANGIDIQPWVIGEVKPDKRCFLRFTFSSSVAVPCRLAYETALSVNFNGEDIPITKDGYFVDKRIYTMSLPGVKVGKNVLLIEAPLGKRTSLENYFILGNFGVQVDGSSASITALPKTISFGSIAEKKLPFYGAAVTYSIPVKLDKKADIRVRTGRYEGAVVTAAVDGKSVGTIAFSPYKLDIFGLEAGKHTLELTLHCTRVNTFSALHLLNDTWWRGPNQWYSTDDKWAYEYQLFRNGLMKRPTIEILD